MSIRAVVLIIFAISVAYALTFLPQISLTFGDEVSYLAAHPEAIAFAAISATILVFGHVVRAYRDTILFSEAAKTKVRSQFMAFAVGSLCNSVLPLRIGELIRADVIAQRFSISFSFSFILICIERLVDVLVLGALSFLLLGFNLPLAVVACVLALIVLVLWSPPDSLKKTLAKSASLLNGRLEAKVLFTFWSLEYGLKRTLRPHLMVRYLAVSLLNWSIYICSLFPVIWFVMGPDQMLRASVGVFVGITTSVAPGALGSYTPTLESLGYTGSPELILLWMIVIVPTAFIGLVLTLSNLKALPLLRRRGESPRTVVLDNKLARNADISLDQLDFMKDYYGGKELAKSIALKEMAGGSAFAKYFTGGGSGAMTYQSIIDDELCVVKLVSQEKSSPLKAQYDWLVNHQSPNIVRAIKEEAFDDSYSIAIEYEEGAIDFFDYVHMRSASESARIIDSVVSAMAENVWKWHEMKPDTPPPDSRKRVEDYINRHITESLKLAASSLPIVSEAERCERLIINGEEYESLNAMLNRIQEEDIFDDLANFRNSDSIHGDLIVDNIIYSPTKDGPVLLDPVGSSGNCFEGPVFDFGKLSQSLQIGYEFLLRDVSPAFVQVQNGTCRIEYRDRKSSLYESLWMHVYGDLAPMYLNESELRTVLFIGATNYFRRMKHQAVQFPQNAMKFYAQGIRYLAAYIELFERS